MTNALGRIAALTMQRSGPVLAGLAIIPLLTLALLGVWYADAQNVADAEAQRIAEERYAKRQAAKLVQQVDDAITERMEDINARFEAGAIEAIRNLYRSDDPVEMVAIYDANGALLFPEAQELRLFRRHRVTTGRLALAGRAPGGNTVAGKLGRLNPRPGYSRDCLPGVR
ncbi:hypothetical protein [Ruegeria hyattellae]|uniref:hypothetical protein n=1 Tax=Ruegeria hyattellae TaxID=3233337 RepID=UPI00355C9722